MLGSVYFRIVDYNNNDDDMRSQQKKTKSNKVKMQRYNIDV